MQFKAFGELVLLLSLVPSVFTSPVAVSEPTRNNGDLVSFGEYNGTALNPTLVYPAANVNDDDERKRSALHLLTARKSKSSSRKSSKTVKPKKTKTKKPKKTKTKKTKTKKPKKTKTKTKKPKKTKTKKPKKTKTKKPKTTKGKKTPKTKGNGGDACKLPKKGKNGKKLAARCTSGQKTVADVPSIDEIKKHLNMEKDTSLFYSGPGGYATKANIWRNKLANRQYRILGSKWKDSNYPDQFQQNQPEAVVRLFNVRASQAMAEASSGVVYVMLPADVKGTNWHKGTDWDVYEWPHLPSAVTKVIKINPDNDDQETIKGA